MEKLSESEIKKWFDRESCSEHFAKAAVEVGLWNSEELVLQRVFDRRDTLLELGCGAGRIALGLWELGYRRVLGTDFSREMITRARGLAGKLEYSVPFRVADATRLPFEDEMFDGVLFGFNGLMQIPGRAQRRQALREMRRVIQAGGKAVFTTHDRSTEAFANYWKAEAARWETGQADSRLIEFGDRIEDTEYGPVYIHIPEREDILADLREAGWRVVEDAMRSEICVESAAVEDFAVNCRFWVVEKPA
jgi:ubiquinone/menaquinone biosynthesis C-methylase UbiE